MGSPHGQGFGEPIGGSNEKTVGKTPTRGLLADATAPEAAKTTWLYSIVTNPVYGGFSMNVLAGIFVRILVFIGTSLISRLCYRRAKKRESNARALKLQRKEEKLLEKKQLIESCFDRFQGYQGSPGTPSVLLVDSSTAESSSTAPQPVPENHAQTTGSIHAGSIPGSPASSTNAVPTVPGELRHRRNGYIESSSKGHATSMSSESPPVAPPCKEHHEIDIPVTLSCYFPSPMETKTGDMFKETVKEKKGVVFGHDVCSSRMMQARVPATEKNLSALREVAIEGMKLDEGFTLQIGASFLYCSLVIAKSLTY